MLVVYRAATGPRACAGGFRAHPGLRRMPHIAARPGARIAFVDARDAGRRGGAARPDGAVSRAGAQVDAMDLDASVWPGRNGRVRAVHRLHRALAAAVGAGRIWRLEPFEFADFSRRLLERMATDDHFVGGARAGD